MARHSRSGVDAEIAAICELPREKLVAAWQKAHGTPPPQGIRRELLVRAAAWHLQAKRLGGFSAETRRLLRSAMLEIRRKQSASDAKDKKAAEAGKDQEASIPKTTSRKVHPGDRLIRDWNGQSHVVQVVDKGFVFEAKVYPSLSAIAQKITGAHWSGPRFFGLVTQS